jgi:hypothetical protein
MQRKIYYKQRKENDPQFLEYKRAKSREYYQRKKAEKEIDEPKEEEKVIEEQQVIDSKPIEEEVIEEVKEVKEKPKRIKKVKIPELEPQPEIVKSELIDFDKTDETENVDSTVLENITTKKRKNNKKSKVINEV